MSWALSEGTWKGTEFPACSLCPFKPSHHPHHRPRPPTMVARVLSSMITGGRAPSRVPAPLPLSHQPSVLWTCCYLFSLSWLCLSQLFHALHNPSTVHSTAPPHHHHKRRRLLVRLAGKLNGRHGEIGNGCFSPLLIDAGDIFSVGCDNIVFAKVTDKARLAVRLSNRL